MQNFSLEDIRKVYQQHPLREDRILARLVSQRGSLEGVTEMDLAHDPLTEITDQNHIGGARFVEELAGVSGIGPHSLVLDLGCGLGGSARYLSHRYGCRVHGIDTSQERCAQAQSLTRLAGLQHLVDFQFGDMSAMCLPSLRFDVLWGQGSWVHLVDKELFLARWSPCLKAGGRVMMEDACLSWDFTDGRQDERLRELEFSWKSHLVTPRVWTGILAGHGYFVEECKDLSDELHAYYSKLIEIDARSSSPEIPEQERTGWRDALTLSESGVLGYFRIVARKLR